MKTQNIYNIPIKVIVGKGGSVILTEQCNHSIARGPINENQFGLCLKWNFSSLGNFDNLRNSNNSYFTRE